MSGGTVTREQARAALDILDLLTSRDNKDVAWENAVATLQNYIAQEVTSPPVPEPDA